MRVTLSWHWAMLMLAAAVPGPLVQAQPAPLTVGLTAPMSGPDADYGLGLKHGVELAVARANAAGGVAGRTLELLALDDGGDPRRAAANVQQLLQRGALALTGVRGARATVAVAEVLAPVGSQSPLAALVAPATSADVLRDPPRRGVFHLRASVAEEASAALLHLDTLGLTRYAVVAQRDPLGDSGHERVMFELTRIATRPVAVERVLPDALLGPVIDKVCSAQPEAVILALDSGPAAAAVKLARARHCGTQYFVFSETGAALALREPGATGGHPLAGLLVTQVVPHPNNLRHPLVAEYQEALRAHGSGNGSYPSLEGYLALRVMHEALRACGRDAGRSCLLQVLATRSFELPGLRVQFGSAQRQSRPFVEITLLDAEGRFRR